MRGLRSTLILLVILLGLIGYIYYLNDRGDTADDREQAFASLEAEQIVEVQIRSADGETSRVEKAGDTWRIVEPVQAAADGGELSSITSSLASLDIQRVVEENATDLKQYGLEPPRIEVAFRTAADKEPRRLFLGERTPTGGDLYARLPDNNRVLLVSSFLDSTFNKNTFALRDKRILTIDRDKVDRLEVAAGARSVTLAKNGGEWRIVAPIEARADFAAVEGSLERLSSAQMQGIVAPDGADLGKYGLTMPVASFTAVSGDSRASLLFGETENALIYAKDASRPMVFTVAPTLYTDLVRDLSELRRKDLFDSRSFTTTRIELQRGTETIVLEKSTGKEGAETWRDAAGAEVDRAKVDDLLTRISGLRAESFDGGPRPPALQSAALTVDVRFDESKSEQVTFARAGTDVLASRSDEPGTARVDAMAFDEVLKAIDAVK